LSMNSLLKLHIHRWDIEEFRKEEEKEIISDLSKHNTNE